jgi:hypothetical protein
MNFQEGMRRIGLTAGVIGALVAAFAAFGLFYSDLAEHRKVQAEFDSLLKLPVTQVVAKTIAKNKTASAHAGKQIPLFSDFVQQRQKNATAGAYAEIQGHPQGIKQFWLDEKSEIVWFEMDDGRTIMRTSGPTSLFWYLLYPPIVGVGFVLPWGAVHLVTWIVCGFIRGTETLPQQP